ncbi:hypothetical protein VP01_791g2 [Puccinia sorghi]|uniref:alpha-1,2-Mannosidase n=1 Tax=Puccinia sorghi TaxID=27349 RepID=A0A0L6UAX5_9BASI|nr:hypothetical protein VP01_791g2 [Puccinia sorghi]
MSHAPKYALTRGWGYSFNAASRGAWAGGLRRVIFGSFCVVIVEISVSVADRPGCILTTVGELWCKPCRGQHHGIGSSFGEASNGSQQVFHSELQHTIYHLTPRLMSTPTKQPSTHQTQNPAPSILITHPSRCLKPRPIAAFILIIILCYALSHSPFRSSPNKHPFALQPIVPPAASQLDQQSQIRHAFLRTFRLYTQPDQSYRGKSIHPFAASPDPYPETTGATIIDSLTALHIMNLSEEFQDALNHTIHLDFQSSDRSDQDIPDPEAMIRSLGAILSTQGLIKSNHTTLLFKAQQIADRILNSWNFNQSAAPYPWLRLGIHSQHEENKPLTVAQAVSSYIVFLWLEGSIALEFNRLSHWLGNDSYRVRADQASRDIMNHPPSFPGRHSPTLTASTGPPVDEIVRWGATLNSFLEYGIKYWQLVGEPAMYYMSHWQDTVDTLIQDILQWSPGTSLPYLAGYSQVRGGNASDMSQLSCFAPSSWMLGGKLLKNEAIFMLGTFGLGMAETCYQAEHSSGGTNVSHHPPHKTKKSKRSFANESLDLQNHADDEKNHMPRYLRPEVAQNLWYAWRLTGDVKWQERAWAIFQASELHFKNTGGYLAPHQPRASHSTKQNSSRIFQGFYLPTSPFILSREKGRSVSKQMKLTSFSFDSLPSKKKNSVFIFDVHGAGLFLVRRKGNFGSSATHAHPFRIDPDRQLGNLREFIEKLRA